MSVSPHGRVPSFPVVVDVLSLEAPWVLVSLDRLVFNNADEVVTLEIQIDRSRFLEFDAPIGEPSTVDFFPYDGFRQTASIIFDPVDELGANAGTSLPSSPTL